MTDRNVPIPGGAEGSGITEHLLVPSNCASAIDACGAALGAPSAAMLVATHGNRSSTESLSLFERCVGPLSRTVRASRPGRSQSTRKGDGLDCLPRR